MQSASAAELKDEVARLHDELATLEQQQLQAINLRSEQKAEFEKNKPQAEMGLKGVRQAQRILSEYYSMEDGKDHQVATGESKTIMGFLEVIEADFAKHLAAMTTRWQRGSRRQSWGSWKLSRPILRSTWLQ